ncbi:MAG: PH domain-containing protein [Halobacteriaceae archaeon]
MERLDPRVRIVWAVGALVSAVVVTVIGVGASLVWLDVGVIPGLVVGVVVFVVGLVFLEFRFRVWRFEVREEELYIRRGVFTRVTTLVPYVRVQHVDSRRGPVERLVGLGSVVVYTAGSRGSDVTIPGLTRERAEALQQRLRDLAIESERDDAV